MLTFSDDPIVAERQMVAIIFYLVAFGHIDGHFDQSEQAFIRTYVRKLVERRVEQARGARDPKLRQELIERYAAHFTGVFEELDAEVRSLFTEAVATGDDVNAFVYSRLKLRVFELFEKFDSDNQRALLASVDELILADGVTHPAETQFRSEVERLLSQEIPLTDADLEPHEPPHVSLSPVSDPPAPRQEDHPFFARLERHYSRDPKLLAEQAAEDMQLVKAFLGKLRDKAKSGQGRLAGHHAVTDFAGCAPFLDGFVHIEPTIPDRETELLVLGDLHGCYSCLKAALLQSDFIAKLEAHKLDPGRHPAIKLVLLGDYIDRGQFSYNGVLRAALALFLHAPDHVFVLRGNHEYYVEHQGRIYGGVRPAEAINTLSPFLPQEVFGAWMELFEALPHVLFDGRLMFVHAGIPRDSAIAARWRDLSSLNDADLRFQMLWSDPSEADWVPPELQDQNSRFPFGRLQFRNFMTRVGASAMIRGHEKLLGGYKKVYDDDVAMLLSLFSAGGKTNDDLPPTSSYRDVTPMALTVRQKNGVVTLHPWAIHYEMYNDPLRNQFFKVPPEIAFNGG